MEVNLLNQEAILVFLKAAILLILVFYAIFALVIIRQVDLMSKTLITGISPYVKLLSLVHAVFVIGLILVAWRVL
ncbi:hypothetical protein HYW41_00645 [Candidatus Daviesbacteria bacterium]|nr:hypothetical protein [Candidatus Daviesbacteria bacterium]